jgi:hypothetical protein
MAKGADLVDKLRKQGKSRQARRLQAGDTRERLEMAGAGGECIVEHSPHRISGEKIPGVPPGNGLVDHFCRIVAHIAGCDTAKRAAWFENYDSFSQCEKANLSSFGLSSKILPRTALLLRLLSMTAP